MPLVRKVAFNFLASSLGRFVGLFFSLASIALIARTLSVEGYGQYSTILAFLFLFLGFADFGLYSLMLREISRPQADEKYIVSSFFTIRLISSIVFLGGASLVVLCFPYSREIKIGVGLCSLGFLFMSLSQVLMPIFQKYLKTDRAAMAEILGRIGQFVLVALAFKIKLGIFWFIFALIFGCAVTFFLNLFFSKKYISFSLNFDFQYFKRILKLAYPVAISIIFTMIYFRGNTILLSLFKSQEDVGIFNLGYKVLENLIFFPAVFVGLMMPFLSFSAINNLADFRRIIQKSFDVIAMGAIPLVLGGFFLSPFVVTVLGGSDFILAVRPLQILLFAVAFIFFGNLAGNSLIALNFQKKLAWIYFCGAVFSIGGNLYLIPKYSYNGAALVTLLTEFLVTVLMFFVIFKKIGWFPLFERGLKAFLASAVMCLPLAFFYNLPKVTLFWGFLILVFAGILYFGALYLLKGISGGEIKALFNLKR